MQTTTTADSSQTYLYPDIDDLFEQELFIHIAGQLTQKWPARDESDHKFIAEKTTSLTRILAQTYRRDFLKEEQ